MKISKNEVLRKATTPYYGSPLMIHDAPIDGFLYLFYTPYGAKAVIRAINMAEAYNALLNLLPPIPENEIPEAYGLYICLRLNDKWLLAAGPGEIRMFFATKREAFEKAREIILNSDRPLVDGYDYQPRTKRIVRPDLNPWANELALLTPELITQHALKLDIRENRDEL